MAISSEERGREDDGGDGNSGQAMQSTEASRSLRRLLVPRCRKSDSRRTLGPFHKQFACSVFPATLLGRLR
eukprot:3083341-Alexandrium_andersonii.AAC.1